MATMMATTIAEPTTTLPESPSDDSSSGTPQPMDVESEELIKSEAALQAVNEIAPHFCFGLASNLRSDYHQTKPLFTDIQVTLQGDGSNETAKVYSFHKPVLAFGSGYFKDLLTENPSMDTHKLNFENNSLKMEPKIFDILAESFYTGNVELINVETANALLKLSYTLQVKYAENQCKRFLIKELNIDNCLDVWLASKFSQQDELLELATAKIGRHLAVVSQYKTFLELDCDTLLSLLDDDRLQVASEKFVYQAAIAWIKHDLVHRQRDLSHLLKVIRFQYLHKNFLTEVVGQEELILTNHDAMHAFSGALQYKLGGVRPKNVPLEKKRRDNLAHSVVGGCEMLSKKQQESMAKQRGLGKSTWESWVDVHVNFPLHFLKEMVWEKYLIEPMKNLVGGTPLLQADCIPFSKETTDQGLPGDQDTMDRSILVEPVNGNAEEEIPGVAKIGPFEKYIVRPIAASPCIPDSDDEDLDEEEEQQPGVVAPEDGSNTTKKPDVVLFNKEEDHVPLQDSVWTKIDQISLTD